MDKELKSNLPSNLKSNLPSNLKSNLKSNLPSNLKYNLISKLTYNSTSNIKKNLILRTIKIIDIAYIFSFYAAAGFFLSIILDRLFPKFSKTIYLKKSTGKIILDICIQFAVIGVIVYIVKNLFELVPFPLNGIQGYEHKKVKELKEALPLIYTIIYFQNSLRHKLLFVAKRFMDK